MSDQLGLAATTSGFAGEILGLTLYDWQAKSLLPLERATGKGGRRQNISVCAPNGSGKDSHLIPAAAYWWLALHPGGRVVITSKSDLQITQQTIPALDAHYRKFGYAPPIKSPHYELTTPEGGKIIAFVTNDPARAEGWHSRPGSPLLMMLNEAKFLDEGIYEAIDGRCSPDAIMLISSPGLKVGRFFETHHKLRAEWHCVSAGLADCPHIPRERIDHVLATYGDKHPVTRSTLYGEFMESDSEDPYVLTREQVLRCIENPPAHLPGFKYWFFDFAGGGGSENVLVARDGNKYRIVDAWREEDKDAVVGRALHLLGREHARQENVCADAAAKDILDAMASAGWTIGRQNFGQRLEKLHQYKSWSVFAWLTGAKKIVDRDVIIPDDATLISQLVDRRKGFSMDGRMTLEEKYQMTKRNVKSPDRADALFGAMAAYDMSLLQPQNFFDMAQAQEQDSVFNGISVGL